ncbi:MAG: aldehyde ferredoxin oxidoreductase C-terminal domain-containing protein [Planctomycetota bacterium]
MTARITGWTGTLLRVDLTTGRYEFESIPEGLRHECLGGRGLAGHYLRQAGTRPWDDPDSPLLLFTGPLTGTACPTSGMMVLAGQSPLTGTITSAGVGGRLGTEIKHAGLDGIIITGRASGLRGLEIHDGQVRLVNAEALRGAEVGAVFRALGDAPGAAIGPAGENRSLLAAVLVDHYYTAGRGGLGAAWGDKGLKYLSVRGSGRVAVADEQALAGACQAIGRLIDASPALMGELGIAHFGTGALYDLIGSRRMMPTANFRRTHFHNAAAMNAWAYRQAYHPTSAGCRGCQVLCKLRRGDGHILPEFETMSHFSALIENSYLPAVVEANDRCRELGLEPISTAGAIACRAELIGQAPTPEAMLMLIDDIAARRGPGAELADGSWRYAAAQGRPELSMSVKKQDLPACDPRGAYGLALGYATSTAGGDHLRAYPITHEILRKPVATDRFTFSGKARIIKISEGANAAVDSLTACQFIFFACSLEEYSRAFSAVTGQAASAQQLLNAGERIYYNERMMNAANGFTSADDDLPQRFFTEAGSSGDGIDVHPIDRADFLAARANYYQVRGLDENGMPTRDKARQLNLPWND